MLTSPGGVLLLDKPKGWTSFDCVAKLRRRLGVQKIGHAGTLDPFATGVLILLIGRQFTSMADSLQGMDKSYWMQVRLGQSTDTFDSEGKVVGESEIQPTLEQLQAALGHFQGEVEQIPPMFSAKKVNGQKLYHLARRGIELERAPVLIRLCTQLIRYEYPFVELQIDCSKGSYMRTIAQDLGELLGCGAHAAELTRTRCGPFRLTDCLAGSSLTDEECDLAAYLKQEVPSAASCHDWNI